ncbi:carbonic anhydrase 9 [Bombina bombina]|uniref:carbonic anhydrase 9 n=1 Tax=Bombina bombina TaxID=8345 RepID=UPI00235ACB5F|nr:carbonic anhydrase 9 [Bombina bombina]
MNQWSLWVLTLHTSFLGHLVISSHERESHEDVHPKGPAHFHWNYEDESHWDAHYSFCGGREQSPINIETRTIKYNPSLKPILLSGYNMSSGEMLTLKNNGHTVVLDLPSNLEIIGGLPQTYRAVQLHFHWGSKSSPGSEHTVNGERFHGEIHVVHYSTEYENISEAQTYPGGLAVLAAFIQEGPDQNPTYDHILSYFEEVNEDDRHYSSRLTECTKPVTVYLEYQTELSTLHRHYSSRLTQCTKPVTVYLEYHTEPSRDTTHLD